MKMKVLLILVAAISCSAIAPPEDTKELKVMSFNIRSDTGGTGDGDNAWYYRQEAVAEMFKSERPNICGMQEVRPGQLADIQSYVKGYQFYGVDRDNGTTNGKGERMVIMWDKKVIKVLENDTFWLSETPDIPSKGWDASYPRTAAWARCRHIPSGKDFFFVCTHLDHRGATARQEGLRLLLSRIETINPDGLPMILVGDFNVTPDNECLDVLQGRMQSARDASVPKDDTPSFNGFGGKSGAPGRILDYIYFQGFSFSKDFRVLDTPYKNVPYISDHYPICVTLQF